MADETFSQRLGLLGSDAESVPRDVVPTHVRRAIVDLGAKHVGLEELHRRLFDLVAIVPPPPRTLADSSRLSEIYEQLDSAQWYEVFDYIEDIYLGLVGRAYIVAAQDFKNRLNRYFEKHGIGWRLAGKRLEVRNAKLSDTTLVTATKSLADAKLDTASVEMHAAIAALSSRPEADTTGAIQHAMAALECVVRFLTKQQKATLGRLMSHYPDLFPAPLNEAVSKLWGYASETSRHVREGRVRPSFETAELVVGIATSLVTYLARQSR